jgi:hypothetical protein
MTLRYAIVPLLLCAVFSVSARGVSAQGEPVPESPALQSLNQQFSRGGVASEVPFYAPASLSLSSPSSSIFRDIPSISGRYSVGGRTVMPPPVQSDVGLRSQLGQGISPNEFQLGLRIPF